MTSLGSTAALTVIPAKAKADIAACGASFPVVGASLAPWATPAPPAPTGLLRNDWRHVPEVRGTWQISSKDSKDMIDSYATYSRGARMFTFSKKK